MGVESVMASLFGSYTDSLSSYYGAITRKNVIQKYACKNY